MSVKEADYEVNELIESAMSDIGLDYQPRDSDAAKQAALRAMSRRALSGAITPAHLAFWADNTFGFDGLELASTLVELDHCYVEADLVETDHIDLTVKDIDTQVIAEARRITSLP